LTSLLIPIALAIPGAASGQATSPTGGTVPAPRTEDVASIDGILAALYDVISGPAGQRRDWDRMRSLFLPEARLAPTFMPQGGDRVQARFLSVEDYIATSGPLLEERGFFETEVGRVLEQFESIAHAFSTYESRWSPEDAEPFQRGINSIQLVWDGQRWWVANILWRGVGPEYEIPKRYRTR
jgi:hypothetical protein